MTPNLNILSNDALIDLGARLESELAQAKSQLDAELSQLVPDQKLLIKPAVKLAMNAALAIAGVTLASLTLNLSLVLTVVGCGVTIWDAHDFSTDAGHVRAARRRIRHIRSLAGDIVQELDEIERLLSQRLGPAS